MFKRIVAIFIGLTLASPVFSMELSLPTSDDAKYETTLKMGIGLGFPDEIVKRVEDPEVKKVYLNMAFLGYQGYKVLGTVVNRLGLPDDDEAKLHAAHVCVSKSVLAIDKQRAMFEKVVEAGGMVYSSSQIHDKTAIFSREDSMPLDAYLVSSNLSNRANRDNTESGVHTTDSPVKQAMLTGFKGGLTLANKCTSDDPVPSTPEKIKQEREEAFRSTKIPFIEDASQPYVFASHEYDIETFRLDKLKNLEDSEAEKKEVYLSTMTIGLTMIGALKEAALCDTKIELLLDKSGVTGANKKYLQELAEVDGVSIHVQTKSGAINHAKFMCLVEDDKVHVEASTQNCAGGNKTKSGHETKHAHSGDEFNTSIVSPISSAKPVRETFSTLVRNPNYVTFSPECKRYDEKCPKKSPKRKKATTKSDAAGQALVSPKRAKAKKVEVKNTTPTRGSNKRRNTASKTSPTKKTKRSLNSAFAECDSQDSSC